MCLSVCLSAIVCLSICLSVCLSVCHCLSVYLSVCLPLSLLCLSLVSLSVCHSVLLPFFLACTHPLPTLFTQPHQLRHGALRPQPTPPAEMGSCTPEQTAPVLRQLRRVPRALRQRGCCARRWRGTGCTLQTPQKSTRNWRLSGLVCCKSLMNYTSSKQRSWYPTTQASFSLPVVSHAPPPLCSQAAADASSRESMDVEVQQTEEVKAATVRVSKARAAKAAAMRQYEAAQADVERAQQEAAAADERRQRHATMASITANREEKRLFMVLASLKQEADEAEEDAEEARIAAETAQMDRVEEEIKQFTASLELHKAGRLGYTSYDMDQKSQAKRRELTVRLKQRKAELGLLRRQMEAMAGQCPVLEVEIGSFQAKIDAVHDTLAQLKARLAELSKQQLESTLRKQRHAATAYP